MNFLIKKHYYILYFSIIGICFLLNSVLPFYLMLCYLIVGNLLIVFFNKVQSDEIRIFNFSFSTSILFYFFSLIFLIYFGDEGQLDSDALNFFNLSSKFEEFNLLALRIITEGSLAVVIWRKIYDLLNLIGYAKEFYVGIFFNIFLNSISSVLILKISKMVNDMNVKKVNNLIFFFSFSGLLILFSTLHVRDVFIFFFFNLMVYLFLYFRINFKVFFIPLSIILSLIFGIIFFYLRTEYLALPILVFISFLFEKIILNFKNYQNKIIPLFSFIFFGILSILLIINTQIFELLKSGYNSYMLVNENVQSLNNSESLATILILNQPLIIRYFLGFIYFIFSPVPFWSGLFSGSFYLFLKSLNVIMMYFLVPAFYLQLSSKSFYIKNRLALLIIFFVGYSSIILTSLELRHLGTFLGLFFVFVSSYDFKSGIIPYIKTLKFVILSVMLVHFLWVALKLF